MTLYIGYLIIKIKKAILLIVTAANKIISGGIFYLTI